MQISDSADDVCHNLRPDCVRACAYIRIDACMQMIPCACTACAATRMHDHNQLIRIDIAELNSYILVYLLILAFASTDNKCTRAIARTYTRTLIIKWTKQIIYVTIDNMFYYCNCMKTRVYCCLNTHCRRNNNNVVIKWIIYTVHGELYTVRVHDCTCMLLMLANNARSAARATYVRNITFWAGIFDLYQDT